MSGETAKARMDRLGNAGTLPLMRVLRMAATLGPVGYVPVAPGTAGSLVAVMVVLALGPIRIGMALACLVPLAGIAILAAGEVARARQQTDPSEVVIDEAAGMWLTLALAPAGVPAAMVAFAAFRVFDVVKPFPVRRLERLPGGWGIVADDLGAALYAAAAVRLVWMALG